MRKLMRYGKAYGGDDPQMIEGDVFRIIVKVPEFGISGKVQAGDQETRQGDRSGYSRNKVTGEVTGEVYNLLKVIGKGDSTRAEAQAVLELKGEANFRERYLGPALEAGLIEMTIPEKPRSSKQKYRLTDTGRQVLIKIQGGG